VTYQSALFLLVLILIIASAAWPICPLGRRGCWWHAVLYIKAATQFLPVIRMDGYYIMRVLAHLRAGGSVSGRA
jgi:hypothetical protein